MIRRSLMSPPVILLPMFLVALVLGTAGCSNDSNGGLKVDIRGLTPDEAAANIADKMCQYMETCGMVSYECSSTPDGPATCSGSIEPSPYNACYAEVNPEIRADLLCAELTPTEQSLVNDCINAMLAYPCLTQAQVDANAAAYSAGEEAPYEQEIPLACQQLDPVFESCEEEGQEELDQGDSPR